MSRALTKFSRGEYAELLREFRAAGYRTIDFPAANALEGHDAPWLVLRHDIDFCPARAREMARVEAEHGFIATYFYMLRTPMYNLFTAENTDAVRETLAAGHRLGLHFDRAAYPANASVAELAEAARREARILEDWFGAKVEVLSYHRPSAREQAGEAEGSYPLLNTYMPAFTKKMGYVSDSMGSFRYGHPLEHEAFKARRAMQFLAHPIWWGDAASEPWDTLNKFIEGRGDGLALDVAKNCKVYRVGRFAGVTDQERS